MLTQEDAIKIITASEEKARELGIKVCTYVVDSSGILIAASKMDGALPVSPKFAYAKAYTAATIGLPTKGIAEYAYPEKPYFGVTDLDSGVFTTISGGQPIKDGEKVVGGIGVGGSYNVEEDDMCAEAGVSSYK